ncbi:hypothetical protein [Bacilliculturomica massiliensis]|uniref:hypothetical protein n=1 Tax=Bacilliculturomica massiliensis TaxID=1917867 RepID=UPI0013EF3F9C|nr:hypothetical protein [Bacilliculturomica massiliensis]
MEESVPDPVDKTVHRFYYYVIIVLIIDLRRAAGNEQVKRFSHFSPVLAGDIEWKAFST